MQKTDNGFQNGFKRLFCGVAVGAINGVFGGGGGMLAVPLLQKTGYEERAAHATAILILLPVCILSFAVYAAQGYADFSVLIPTAIGACAGGFLGACFLGKLPIKTVRFLFTALQFIAGVYFLLR